MTNTDESNMLTPKFSYLLRVRYGECDAQQVVFNARYADYIDVALTEYFRQLVGGFQALLNKGLDNQVVSLHIDWKSSAAFDDVLCLNVYPKKVGNTSYSFIIQIENNKDRTLIAQASVTYVMVDTKSYQKAQVPDWLRALIMNEEQFATVDHASLE